CGDRVQGDDARCMDLIIVDVLLALALFRAGGLSGELPRGDQSIALQTTTSGAARPRHREDVRDPSVLHTDLRADLRVRDQVLVSDGVYEPSRESRVGREEDVVAVFEQ